VITGKNSQSKICQNLRYSLEQLKLGSDVAMYSKIVDSVVLGPALLNMDDVENTLGIEREAFDESNIKRQCIQPTWTQMGDTLIFPTPNDGPKPGSNITISLPTIDGKCKVPMKEMNTLMHLADLHDQFGLFSKFGSSRSDGAEITLSQSDKWLRQATVIDGWNVTTTDTAIAFRKISRGATRSHAEPRGATRSHAEPRGATQSQCLEIISRGVY
jgi:hypothetical protein